MKDKPIDVIFTHVGATRQFNGFLGPLWTIIHCYIARRQDIKLMNAQTKAANAAALAVYAETQREVTIAKAKVDAITMRCKNDVHEVEKWTTGAGWVKRNRFTNDLLEEYYIMHGKCKHCGSLVSKRHYTYPPDKKYKG